MSMRNPNAPHVDFGFMRGIIPANDKILPSNIDMAYGISGNFLFGEWKQPGENIMEGQKILLRFLSEHPKTSLLLITGFSTKLDTQVFDIYQIKDRKQKQVGYGVDHLKEIIAEWSTSFVIPNKL